MSVVPMTVGAQVFKALLLGLLALAVVVLAVPILTVGLLVLGFGGTFWVAIVGFLLFLSGAPLFWAAWRAQLTARRLRAARTGPTRAFVSYRTAEHGSWVSRIATALQEQGIVVHVAPTEPMGADRPWTIFRLLGLFQSTGLDADLQRWLLDSDALVYCVPSPSRRRDLSMGRRLQDAADTFLALLLLQGGLSWAYWQSVWQEVVYGRRVTPPVRVLSSKSWQDWELRVAHSLNLEIVPVVLGDAGADMAGVRLGPDALDADVRERVVPKLAGLRKPPPEITDTLPILGLALLGVFTVVVVLLLVVLSAALFFLVRAIL